MARAARCQPCLRRGTMRGLRAALGPGGAGCRNFRACPRTPHRPGRHHGNHQFKSDHGQHGPCLQITKPPACTHGSGRHGSSTHGGHAAVLMSAGSARRQEQDCMDGNHGQCHREEKLHSPVATAPPHLHRARKADRRHQQHQHTLPRGGTVFPRHPQVGADSCHGDCRAGPCQHPGPPPGAGRGHRRHRVSSGSDRHRQPHCGVRPRLGCWPARPTPGCGQRNPRDAA